MVDLCKGLACPSCGRRLDRSAGKEALECDGGHTYPIVRGVPRLVGQGDGAGDQSFDTLESFNFQYKLGAWTHQYDVERTGRVVRDLARLERGDIEDKDVVIIGAGNGAEIRTLGDLGARRIIGADLTESIDSVWDYVEDLKDRCLLVQVDACNAFLVDESVDVAYSDGVLPHTERPFDVVRNMVRAIKPGGMLCLRTLMAEPARRVRLRSVLSRVGGPLLWKLCFAFGLINKIPLLGSLARRTFVYVDPHDDRVRVTQLKSFRFYGPHTYRRVIPREEIREFLDELGCLETDFRHGCFVARKVRSLS